MQALPARVLAAQVAAAAPQQPSPSPPEPETPPLLAQPPLLAPVATSSTEPLGLDWPMAQVCLETAPVPKHTTQKPKASATEQEATAASSNSPRAATTTAVAPGKHVPEGASQSRASRKSPSSGAHHILPGG